MRTFILDASVALRWFLETTVSSYALKVERLLLNGDRAIVPSLWHLEIANALVVSERRKLLQATDSDRIVERIEGLLSRSIDTDPGLVSTRQACSLARSWRLSAYDASYLHLAHRTGFPLATLDDDLRLAAQQSGIEIV